MKQNSDITAAVLSSLAVIIQLLLFVITTVTSNSQSIGLFVLKDFIPFVTLIAVFLALASAAVYSYIHKNKDSFRTFPSIRPLKWLISLLTVPTYPSRWATEKKILVTTFLVLLISATTFVLSTISYIRNENVFLFHKNNVAVWQTLSYMLLWVSTSVILFIWIINERERQQDFKEEDFIKNFYDSLREQGYLSVTVKTAEIDGERFCRYVIAEIGKTPPNEHFLRVSWDGKRIEKEYSSFREMENDKKKKNKGSNYKSPY